MYASVCLDCYGENSTGRFCQQTLVTISAVQNVTMIVEHEDSCFQNTVFDDILPLYMLNVTKYKTQKSAENNGAKVQVLNYSHVALIAPSIIAHFFWQALYDQIFSQNEAVKRQAFCFIYVRKSTKITLFRSLYLSLTWCLTGK